jgi:hypothetical protein
MFRFLFRSLWRLIIFALGLALIWLAVELFPYADAQLPQLIVLFLMYCLFAYGLIPLLIRLFRVVIKPDHIPLYVTTADGWPSDPVNIAIIAKNRRQLEAAMNKAGWHTSDPLTLVTGARELFSIIFNTSYPKAPLSRLYLFNRSHDIGFEIPTNSAGSARTRHHVRFWRLEEPPIHDKHYAFWIKKLRHLLHMEKELWIGAATEETHPIDLQWRTGQLTHGGSHDSDSERDFIIRTLEDASLVKSLHKSDPGEKLRFRGQQFRTFYITDGGIKVVRLR